MPFAESQTLARWDRLPPAVRSRHHRLAAELRRYQLRLLLVARDLRPVVRRALDVAVSLLALLALAPLLAACALAIKLTSRGPVLFRQQRVGHRGRFFEMYKLRTMRRDADAQKVRLWRRARGSLDEGIRFKLQHDPRVTRLGRVLRKLSIDELPQLINVLRGEMTIIGPRPALWSEVVLHDARALRRLEVKPGLTCLWQISGRSDLSFSQQIDLDLEYIDRTSAWRELGILVRTIPAVLTGRGAY